jgi:hypothetical protein
MPRCPGCSCEITVFEECCKECADYESDYCNKCSSEPCLCWNEPDVDEQQEMEDFAQDNLLENNYADE